MMSANKKSAGPKTGAAILMGLALVCLLLGTASCSTATDSKSPDSTSPFTGTWLDQVSATHTYQYIYSADKSFEYTEKDNGAAITHLKGTYSYTAPSSYTEHVTAQDNGTGFVAADWNTPYTYTFNGATLHFDDGNGYTPSFTKQ